MKVRSIFEAYFGGTLSLPELEKALSEAASDPESRVSVIQELKSAFAAGRLPTQVYQVLLARVSPDGTEEDATIMPGVFADDDSTVSPDAAPEADPTVAPELPADDGTEATLLVGREPPQEETELTNQAGTDDEAGSAEPSGIVHEFPTRASPDTGTGSNWAHPDQWSDKHTGPIGQGTVIKDRFQIESQLGKGGMGTVFRARDRRKDEAQDSDPHIAIKILNEEFKNHPQSLVALQREATKAQSLAHPNIVTVYDFDRDGSTVFMTMELMRGEPLSAYIRGYRKGGADREVAAPIILDMARGLGYAHERNIVHSDFKPGNVFLTEEGRAKVLDFGIARAAQHVGEPQARDAFDAGDLGAMTPGYASLEMQRGEPPHPADDVYALAITAYQLLTGEHPFNRKTAREALELGLRPKPIKGLKRREWKAIERGLAFHRKDRVQNADEFLKLYRGATPVRKSVYATLAAAIALAVFFGVRSAQDLPGPFPEDQRAVFEEAMAMGEDSFRIAVAGGEVTDVSMIAAFFNRPWEIHPKNARVKDWLETIADESLDRLSGDTDEKRVVIKNLMLTEYLCNYRPVLKACQSLGTAECDGIIEDHCGVSAK